MSPEQITRADDPTLFDFLDSMEWNTQPGTVTNDEGNRKRGHLAVSYPAPTMSDPDRREVWAIVDLGDAVHFTGSGLRVDADGARAIAAHLLTFAERAGRRAAA